MVRLNGCETMVLHRYRIGPQGDEAKTGIGRRLTQMNADYDV
jgi:hypothetical protein